MDELWLRGGFPESLLARDAARSLRWRQDFIRSYLERDIPQFGRRIAAETLRRLWAMLAHHQDAEETATVEPAPKAEKKRSTLKLSVVLSRIMVLLLVAAVAGLGYWAYTLNSQLVETRQQLTTLQEEHANLEKAYATLTDANATLTARFSQTKADLEKANTDLAEAQKEAKKWKTVSTDLGVKVDQVSKLPEVLYAWNTADAPEDVLDINSLIEKSEDDFLIKLWKELANLF